MKLFAKSILLNIFLEIDGFLKHYNIFVSRILNVFYWRVMHEIPQNRLYLVPLKYVFSRKIYILENPP